MADTLSKVPKSHSLEMKSFVDCESNVHKAEEVPVAMVAWKKKLAVVVVIGSLALAALVIIVLRVGTSSEVKCSVEVPCIIGPGVCLTDEECLFGLVCAPFNCTSSGKCCAVSGKTILVSTFGELQNAVVSCGSIEVVNSIWSYSTPSAPIIVPAGCNIVLSSETFVTLHGGASFFKIYGSLKATNVRFNLTSELLDETYAIEVIGSDALFNLNDCELVSDKPVLHLFNGGSLTVYGSQFRVSNNDSSSIMGCSTCQIGLHYST